MLCVHPSRFCNEKLLRDGEYWSSQQHDFHTKPAVDVVFRWISTGQSQHGLMRRAVVTAIQGAHIGDMATVDTLRRELARLPSTRMLADVLDDRRRQADDNAALGEFLVPVVIILH